MDEAKEIRRMANSAIVHIDLDKNHMDWHTLSPRSQVPRGSVGFGCLELYKEKEGLT